MPSRHEMSTYRTFPSCQPSSASLFPVGSRKVLLRQLKFEGESINFYFNLPRAPCASLGNISRRWLRDRFSAETRSLEEKREKRLFKTFQVEVFETGLQGRGRSTRASQSIGGIWFAGIASYLRTHVPRWCVDETEERTQDPVSKSRGKLWKTHL